MKIITGTHIKTLDVDTFKVSSIKKITMYKAIENTFTGNCQIYCNVHLLSGCIFDVCFEAPMLFNHFLNNPPFLVEFKEGFEMIECMNGFPPIGDFVAM